MQNNKRYGNSNKSWSNNCITVRMLGNLTPIYAPWLHNLYNRKLNEVIHNIKSSNCIIDVLKLINEKTYLNIIPNKTSRPWLIYIEERYANQLALQKTKTRDG